jgi:hypothetical protein
MRFKVYLLRHRGRRLAWRDVHNGRSYIGALVTHVQRLADEQYCVLELRPADPMSTDRPAPLYQPMLIRFAPLAFRLRGFERVDSPDGSYAVVQEWHIEEG